MCIYETLKFSYHLILKHLDLVDGPHHKLVIVLQHQQHFIIAEIAPPVLRLPLRRQDQLSLALVIAGEDRGLLESKIRATLSSSGSSYSGSLTTVMFPKGTSS
jgi:hypothetical protein